MKQIRFGQRPSFPEQAVEGGPGLRVGGQSGGEAGISAAQGGEAVPSPGPPGLRGAVTVEASAGRANRRPWAGVLRAPSGFGGESAAAGPAPAVPGELQPGLLRVPAPASASPAPGPAFLPSPRPRVAPSPWDLARAPGATRLTRSISQGRRCQSRLLSHIHEVQIETLETRSHSLGFGRKNVESAPLPSRCLSAPHFGPGMNPGCRRSLHGPWYSRRPPARPSWGQSASALLPNSIPIFTPVHQHHQVTSEKRDRPQETPPHQPPAGVCDVNVALMVQCWPCRFILASFLGLAMCVAQNRLSTKVLFPPNLLDSPSGQFYKTYF